MSLNRALLIAALLAATASITGCATHNAIDQSTLRTPTEQYVAKADDHVDGIQLAVHEGALSTAQLDAIWGLVSTWKEAGSGQIHIETPQGPLAADTAAKIEDALQGMGLRRDQYSLSFFEGSGPEPAVRISYKHYVATIPRCGLAFSDYTATKDNGPEQNFGCAVTANIAAMVANPADLAVHRPIDPPDAGRRQVVLDKYRAGEATSSAKDDQADGTVSSVAKQ